MMWETLEPVGALLLLCVGIAWSIIVFIHTLSFPLSEDKMRMIIREEVKKITEETKK